MCEVVGWLELDARAQHGTRSDLEGIRDLLHICSIVLANGIAWNRDQAEDSGLLRAKDAQ